MEEKKTKKEIEAEKEENRKENIIAFAVVGILVLIVAGFFTGWWGLFDSDSKTTNPIVSTPITGEPVKGDPDSPITIVEYSDFECPVCGNWFRTTYPQIQSQYIDTGKVRMIYKQYPLTRIHEFAFSAAMASECAKRQGDEFFWSYHDILMSNQNALDDESLKKYAEDIGLNTDLFNSCLDNEETKHEVDSDFIEGTGSGVTGTPAFIIGRTKYSGRGELVVGAYPFMTFEEIIERIS